MAIYRFSKWQPSAILELFYHHTRQLTKSLLLAAAACQISCQSDTQIWRYSYLSCSHIFLEVLIQAPKMGGFRVLWTHKCDCSSSRPQKAHHCVNPRLLSYQLQKSVEGPTCRRVDRICHTHMQTATLLCPCIALDRQWTEHMEEGR